MGVLQHARNVKAVPVLSENANGAVLPPVPSIYSSVRTDE